MPALSAPVLAAAVVLAVAGVAKLARPSGTVLALREAGLPTGTALVSVLGIVELALGTTVVVWAPRAALALLAVAYVAFAAFSARLLARRGGAASCGCFGAARTPLHPLHIVLNLAVAACVAAGAGWGIGDVSQVGPALMLATLVAAAALVLALTALPEVLHASAEVLARDD